MPMFGIESFKLHGLFVIVGDNGNEIRASVSYVHTPTQQTYI